MSKAPQQQSISDAERTVQRVMGNHPQDILSGLRGAAQTLLTIADAFGMMEKSLTRGHTEAVRRHISTYGYLAQSIGEITDGMRDEAIAAMRAAGLETLDEREARHD